MILAKGRPLGNIGGGKGRIPLLGRNVPFTSLTFISLNLISLCELNKTCYLCAELSWLFIFSFFLLHACY